MFNRFKIILCMCLCVFLFPLQLHAEKRILKVYDTLKGNTEIEVPLISWLGWNPYAPPNMPVFSQPSGKLSPDTIQENTIEVPDIISLKIIGEDEREDITAFAPKIYPYSATVYLSMGKGSCSGAMVGKYTVLTAAHCVYDYKNQQLRDPQKTTAYPGGKASKIKAKGTRFIIPQKAIEAKDYNQLRPYDFALIVLEKPLGKRVGWFGGNYNAPIEVGTEITILGRPGDKKPETIWRSPGRVIKVYPEGSYFLHDADTLPGNSGSLVALTSDITHIIAVHSGGRSTHNYAAMPKDNDLFLLVSQYQHEEPAPATEETARKKAEETVNDIKNRFKPSK